MFKWLDRLLGDENGFKDYKFTRGTERIVLRGRYITKYCMVDAFDSMWRMELYKREDSSYSVVHRSEHWGPIGSITTGLTKEQIRNRYPGLAENAGFTKEVRV